MSTNYWDAMADEAEYESYINHVNNFFNSEIEDIIFLRYKDFFLKSSDNFDLIKLLRERVNFYNNLNDFGPLIIYLFLAIDFTLRNVIIKPLISSSIIHEDLSKILLEKIIDNNYSNKFILILKKYIQIASGIDVDKYAFKKSNRTIWNAFTDLKLLRNQHIHEFKNISKEDIKIEYFELFEFFTNDILILIKKNAV